MDFSFYIDNQDALSPAEILGHESPAEEET